MIQIVLIADDTFSHASSVASVLVGCVVEQSATLVQTEFSQQVFDGLAQHFLSDNSQIKDCYEVIILAVLSPEFN